MVIPPCILIVDDNPENLRILGTVLSTRNYRIVAAQNGVQALKALESIEPDLILLDIMMPVMDGYETCKRIKENANYKGVSIIFLTAKAEDIDVVKGFELGAVDYITKPFESRVLLARVETHVRLSQYYKKLESQAYLDGLTQIPNRLRFDQVLQTEWQRNLRLQTPLAVIMLDVDFFKQVNDYYGHLVGDEVLKKIANVLTRQTKRAGDFVARYGGEEFVVILPNTVLKNAQRVAEAIRCEVEALVVPNIKIPLQPITVSLGVASMIPEHTLTVTEFVAQADQQLYLAKQQGRNQMRPSVVTANL